MERYLLHQPKSLESLAIRKLGDYIALQADKLVPIITELHQRNCSDEAETLLSQKIEIIRSRLDCNVPRILRDELLNKTILVLKPSILRMKSEDWNDFKEGRNIRCLVYGRMIETLFIENITIMSLDDETVESMFLTSLFSKADLLTGLTQLHISSHDTCHSTFQAKKAQLDNLIKKLPNLKNLSLNFCTRDILRCIVDSCKFIETLDFSHRYNIKDDDMEILTELLYLKSVNLEDTLVTQKGIKTLILSCENIEYIGTRWIAPALEDIASSKENIGKRFKLKYFKNEYATTLKQLDVLVKMCPRIEKVIFDNCPPNPSYGGCCLVYNSSPTPNRYNLRILNDLHDLRELTLYNYSFYYDKIYKVLHVRGENLVTLNLKVGEMDLNTMEWLILMCPNLQSLSLELLYQYEEKNIHTTMRNLFDRTRNYLTNLLYNKFTTEETEIPQMKKLKKLSLNIDPEYEHILIFVLSSCPNVESILTLWNTLVTDDIMLKVLDENTLAKLKELDMVKSSVSILFVDRLVQNCINSPVIKFNFGISEE